MNPVRVGVIGAGWGQLQVEAFQHVRSARVVALCDIDSAKCAQLANKYHIDRTYTGYGELIASDVDCVSVASPPGSHDEIIQAAVSAGKHVIAEKPLSLRLETSKRLAEMAQSRRIVHAVDLQMRFLPAVAYVKELVDEDYLGPLFRVDVTTIMERPWGEHGNWAVQDAAGGGILTEFGTYFVDVLRWWFGDVTSVIARRSTHYPTVRVPGKKEKGNGQSLRQPVSGDDAFWSVLRFARGGEAVVNFISGARHDAGWTINIYGHTGTLLIRSGQLWAMREGDREMGLMPIPKRLELSSNPDDPLMWAMTKLFVRCIDSMRDPDKKLPYPDFWDSFAAEQIIHAMKRASEKNTWHSVMETRQ